MQQQSGGMLAQHVKGPKFDPQQEEGRQRTREGRKEGERKKSGPGKLSITILFLAFHVLTLSWGKINQG